MQGNGRKWFHILTFPFVFCSRIRSELNRFVCVRVSLFTIDTE